MSVTDIGAWGRDGKEDIRKDTLEGENLQADLTRVRQANRGRGSHFP